MADPTIPMLPTLMGTFFAHNVPHLVLHEMDEAVQMSVSIGSSYVATGIRLIPDKEQKITIRIDQFAKSIKAVARPEAVWGLLPTIHVYIYTQDGRKTEYSYTIIPGGIAIGRDTEELLSTGFLTWQPQQVETTTDQPQYIAIVKSRQYSSLIISSRLTATNGQTYTKDVEKINTTNSYHQISVGFRDIWAGFCIENNLTPLSYDVFGTATLSDGTIKTPRPYPQRYILRAPKYNDTCFGFINTLGGFDTFMATGKIILKPQGDIQTFVNGNEETEVENDYTSYWEASTGHIDTEGMAILIQDFLKSSERWLLANNIWQKIIVDEYKVEHTALELNAYTFKYHLAKKDEHRYFQRQDLPEVKLPTQYFKHDDIAI